MSFTPGINVKLLKKPLGFEYGGNVTGPEPEMRPLDAIRGSLLDPLCEGPDPVYAIAMDVSKKVHKPILEKLGLLFGIVSFTKGKLGKEPVRSQGHIHKISEKTGWSTPEVYEVWAGEAIIYMQEYTKEDPGRCFAVEAGPGDVVIVPPGWAHATISADPKKPLTFGAWCTRDYGFDYKEVRAHKGLAYYPLLDESGQVYWELNKNYRERQLSIKKPNNYSLLGLETNKPIYRQFEEDYLRFKFVVNPEQEIDKWIDFIP